MKKLISIVLLLSLAADAQNSHYPQPGGGGGGTVTAVTATAPVASSGGTSPNISETQASGSVNGWLSSTDWTTFNGKQSAGSYITALTGDVAASGPGSSAATIQPLSVTNSKIANSTIDLTAKVTNVLPASNGGAPPTTRYLWVDVQRTDSYTADGSFSRPFKTIQASINQIVTNADNSTHPYVISVNPGAYAESLTFNSAQLYNVFLNAVGSTPTGASGGVSLSGSPAISSTTTNTNLGNLIFTGFTFGGGITLTGDVNNTNFGSTQILFNGCDFEIGGGNVSFTNVNNINIYGGQFNGTGTVTFNNIAFGYIEGAEGFHSGSTLTLVQNNGGNQPSQAGGNYVLLSGTKNYAATSIDAGSELDSLVSYFGSGSTLVNNGTVHSFNTQWNGTLTLNNGSTTRLQGDNLLNNPTINSGATLNNRGWFYGSGGIFGTTAIAATNALIVYKDGHLKSTQTTAPTAAPNANAGTGATCTVSNATDSSGTINLTTTATTPVAGAQCAVTFNKAYNVAPICVISPSNGNASLFAGSNGSYFTTTTTTLIVNYANADAIGHANTWSYRCIETQ